MTVSYTHLSLRWPGRGTRPSPSTRTASRSVCSTLASADWRWLLWALRWAAACTRRAPPVSRCLSLIHISVKGKQSATGRNPSGAAAPPLFDKGGKGAVCNIIALKLGSTTDTLHENAGRFLLRIFRKPSPLPLHNCAVSLIIYYKCTIRRGVPRCRQNHKNRCWESWEGWDLRPAVICICLLYTSRCV